MSEAPKNHPAYGAVRITRTSGNVNLFMCTAPHLEYITIAFFEAEMVRRGNKNEHQLADRKPLLSVSMSYSQFAALMAQADRFQGIPCTLSRRIIDGEYQLIPEPPIPDEVEQFKQDIQKEGRQVTKHLDHLRFQITSLRQDKGKTGAKDLDQLLLAVDQAIDGVHGGMALAQEQAKERVEELSHEASIEAQAAVDMAVRQVGLQAIAAGESLKEVSGAGSSKQDAYLEGIMTQGASALIEEPESLPDPTPEEPTPEEPSEEENYEALLTIEGE
jgi:hypothetical protein